MAEGFTGADVQMSYVIEMARMGKLHEPYASLEAWMSRSSNAPPTSVRSNGADLYGFRSEWISWSFGELPPKAQTREFRQRPAASGDHP